MNRCSRIIQRSFSAKSKKVTPLTLAHKKRRNEKITMLTAYDYPSALHVDRAGIDVLLVGDSVAMVELGYATTQPITLDEMLHHCKAVSRATNRPLLVGDMPFGSYEVSIETALTNAQRYIKEANMDAVKIEGPKYSTISSLSKNGIAVMGHVGLLPQSISTLGGFRAQGRTAQRALQILEDALRIQDAGAFALVIECVPSLVAENITEALEIPTIGIGSGLHCSGQVLVYHDLLGMTSHPHHEQFTPTFCKRYAKIGEIISQSLEQYKQEVTDGTFPNESYSPYKMQNGEKQKFQEILKLNESDRLKKREEVGKKWYELDEYEVLKLYGEQQQDGKKK